MATINKPRRRRRVGSAAGCGVSAADRPSQDAAGRGCISIGGKRRPYLSSVLFLEHRDVFPFEIRHFIHPASARLKK